MTPNDLGSLFNQYFHARVLVYGLDLFITLQTSVLETGLLRWSIQNFLARHERALFSAWP